MKTVLSQICIGIFAGGVSADVVLLVFVFLRRLIESGKPVLSGLAAFLLFALIVLFVIGFVLWLLRFFRAHRRKAPYPAEAESPK